MRYRSKPTEVEAVQWTGDNEDEVDATPAQVSWHVMDASGRRVLHLLAGAGGAQEWVPVPEGHWIVWNPDDEVEDYWPVADAYFTEKYEPIEEPEQQVQCCCRWGDAVSGEWPEWECWDCPLHGNGMDTEPQHRCRRHTREVKDSKHASLVTGYDEDFDADVPRTL